MRREYLEERNKLELDNFKLIMYMLAFVHN